MERVRSSTLASVNGRGEVACQQEDAGRWEDVWLGKVVLDVDD